MEQSHNIDILLNTSNRKVQQMGKDSAIGPELSENILGSLVDMRGLFEHSKGFI